MARLFLPVLAAGLLAPTRTSEVFVHRTRTTRQTSTMNRSTTCYDPKLNLTLRGLHFNVTTIDFWPAAFVEEGEWTGIYMETWAKIAELEGFTYSVIETTGSWDSAVEAVAAGAYNFAIGPWFLTSDRLQVVDKAGVVESNALRVLTPQWREELPVVEQVRRARHAHVFSLEAMRADPFPLSSSRCFFS